MLPGNIIPDLRMEPKYDNLEELYASGDLYIPPMPCTSEFVHAAPKFSSAEDVADEEMSDKDEHILEEREEIHMPICIL
jgi:hypothetical protein